MYRAANPNPADAPDTWAWEENETDCDCQAQQLEPWQRPLLTQRKGMRTDGRLGAINGCIVDGVTYPHPGRCSRDPVPSGNGEEHRGPGRGQQLDLSGPAPNNNLMRAYRARQRNDALGVEVVVDGERLIEITPGHWICARTGKPWRKSRQEVTQ